MQPQNNIQRPTPRGNLLKVLRHEKPGWIPVVGVFDSAVRPGREGMPPELAEALGDWAPAREPGLRLCRYLGLEVMEGCPIPVKTTPRNVVYEQKTEGDFTTEVWHTPAGDLRQVYQACRDSSGAVSSNFIEHGVKGPADLEAVAAIYADQVIEPDPEGIRKIRQRRELIGADGFLVGGMAGTPLACMYRTFSGVATLAYLWADARQELLDCLAVMEGNFRQCLQTGVRPEIELDALMIGDDTSTTVISPAMFEACNMDLTNARAAAARAAGKFYIHHSCGHIRDLLSLYRKTSMDAVDEFTVPPLGNVTVGEGRRLLGDRIAIIASLPHRVWKESDRAAARAGIQKMITEAGQDGHFILKLAPPFGAAPGWEYIRFVVDCCREAGGNRQ